MTLARKKIRKRKKEKHRYYKNKNKPVHGNLLVLLSSVSSHNTAALFGLALRIP
jgi:hypothetical protein